ncbi:MepB family protein [Flavobacterium foetidum]|uniref:MepB family protein n=1 Tax=Flavobacterium foetidum TaxID=2026681 RepID=UPI001074DA57|nr:MepB family protein [Flavobacterium foetidum]KAF2514324.1 MepB family protein [Flavobacterium foetidum]
MTSAAKSFQPIPTSLNEAKYLVYDVCNFEFSLFAKENESEEYSACRFELNAKKICFREAKITPTKTGQFVTLWKRNSNGTIEPFDDSDPIDFVIVSVRKDLNWGHFIFPKNILLEKSIFSTPNKEGIRATRVYPPWDETTSKQAQKTQKWQLDYFFSFSDKSEIDFNRIKTIFYTN